MRISRCRRSLQTQVEAERFVQNILGIMEDVCETAKEIVEAEIQLDKLESRPTATHQDYRDLNYREDLKRGQLYQQVLTELATLPRLEDDDEIKLGCGGAMPEQLKKECLAYIVSGAPASGKSGIAARLAGENGAYILDSDYAKRKFPEYRRYSAGASLVHKESDDVIFDEEDSLFEYCVYRGYNVVLPLVSKSCQSVLKFHKQLAECGYQVHFVNVALDRYLCTKRAFQRFRETNRYVPLSYVFDEVGHEPELVYFKLKRDYAGRFASFAQLSTDVERGSPPKVLEASETSPIYSWNPGTPDEKR